MSKMPRGLFFVPLILASSTFVPQLSTVFAQGTAFTYQGRLNDSGSPANGYYDFRFRLASDPLANNYIGTPLLTNAVPVSNGLFTTTVDFGTGIFAGSNYWLEVDVRTNGATSYNVLTPLQAVTPTPYAIMANSASNLLGNLPAVQLSGTVPLAQLPAAVITNNESAPVTLNGGGITNINAAALNGLNSSNFWQTGGNNVATGQFLGSINNQAIEFWVNQQRALRLEPTLANDSPNLIGGSSANFVQSGVIGATIAGGGGTDYSGTFTNRITGNFGAIGGGGGNIAGGGDAAFVGGGEGNQASNSFATVGGGANNSATGEYATIAGGRENSASGTGAFVGGGGWDGIRFGPNVASGGASTIAGGDNNVASDLGTTIGGGVYNVASNAYATVPGGVNNLAGGAGSFAAGEEARALHAGAFVWSDSEGTTFASTAANQFLVRAEGGVGIDTATTVEGSLTVNTNIYLDDHPIFLRGGSGSDHNHGLAYNGGAVTNFGSGNAQVDGPVLWGYSGGALGVVNGGAHPALLWNSGGVQIGTNGTALSTIQAGQSIMPSSTYAATNFTIAFPQPFTSTPKILVSVANDPGWPDVNDTFAVSVSSSSVSAFRVNVVRVDTASGWSQQLRINWQAWQ